LTERSIYQARLYIYK